MSQSNYNSRSLPPGVRAAFTFEPLPDGTLRVVKSAKAHRYRLGCSFFWVLGCGALAAYMVYDIAQWRLLPSLDMLPVTVLRWLFTAALVLVSLWSAMDLFWKLLGKEEWRVSHNLFEWHGNVLGIRWVRRYQGSKIWLGYATRSDSAAEETTAPPAANQGSVEGHLQVAKRDSKLWPQRHLYQSANLAELFALGELLAQRLSWPLEQDAEFARAYAAQAAQPSL